MKNTVTLLLRPLQPSLLVLGALLAFSPTGRLAAVPPPIAAPVFNGYIGSDYSIYSMRSNTSSWTSGAWSLDGAYSCPIDSLSTLQFDADYFRLSPGRGLGGMNAWNGDVHYSYKMDDIPVGGFAGAFTNHGNSIWGGGIETSLPVGKCGWLPWPNAPASDSSVLNLQGLYGRNSQSGTNRWGGRGELRLYPEENVRVGANFSFQHTADRPVGPFTFTTNIWSVGASADYLFPCGWSVYGDYEHTHFNRTGFNVDGFTLGVRYCFGRTPKIRDTVGLGYANFSQLLGVSAKF